MKKYFITLMATIGLSFLITGCGVANLTPEVAKTFKSKAKMYTQFNMHYYTSRGQNLISTTNYQVGTLIPVNSEVTMQDVDPKKIIFLYKDQQIILVNVKKYSGLEISAIASKYFSTKKVNLSKFSTTEQRAIKSAIVVKGMHRNAVLISIGTPPVHRTPDLKMDTWTYWRNRFATYLVSFKNGKVI